MREHELLDCFSIGEAGFDEALKGVEGNNRWDGNHEPDRCRDQGFRDAGHDDGRAARWVEAQGMERLNNTDDRAKESDKRCVIAQGPQNDEAAVERLFFAHDIARRDVLNRLSTLGAVLERRQRDPTFERLALAAESHRFVDFLRVEKAQEHIAKAGKVLETGSIEIDGAIDHDSNRGDAEGDQQP